MKATNPLHFSVQPFAISGIRSDIPPGELPLDKFVIEYPHTPKAKQLNLIEGLVHVQSHGLIQGAGERLS